MMKLRLNARKLILFLKFVIFALILQQYSWDLQAILAQRTILDVISQDVYRPIRLLTIQIVGPSGDNPQNIAKAEKLGRTQHSSTRVRKLSRFCDTKNGPGRRSVIKPVSVHRLRPGDIDIIGGMGDSLTAGIGIFATALPHLAVENRGASWSVGGRDNWTEYLTLPNILKEFNPNLYGYSIKDGLSTDRESKFNVADLGTMSRDIPYQASVLLKRLQHDSHVNMQSDWKLITLLVGNNDFCADICYIKNPMDSIKYHEEDMLKTYRYLRDNIPRLMLNVVPPPNLILLTRLTGISPQCQVALRAECPCLIGRNREQLEYYDGVIKKWIAKDYEIAERDEFNTEDFTINIQPFGQFPDIPKTSEGKSDTTLLSEDCFHLSQLGHSLSANGIWNNMLEPNGQKTIWNPILFDRFLCPSKQRPYLMTRVNSRKDFRL